MSQTDCGVSDYDSSEARSFDNEQASRFAGRWFYLRPDRDAGAEPRASHDALLPVLESALFANRLIATLRLYALSLALALGVAFRLAPRPPRLSLSARLTTAAFGRDYLDRSQ